MNKGTAQILHDILSIGAERGLAIGGRHRVPIPTTDELYGLCELLAQSPAEEAIQRYLELHPGYLTGLLGGPDNTDLAILLKPPIGTLYKADFCVLQAHQGGAVAHLIEIESSHERLFTKDGRTAKRLSDAMTQVEDWRIWIERERQHYSRELIRMARELPKLSEYQEGARGFRLLSPDDIEFHWRSFGGYDQLIFSFTILIGRWSKLSNEEKARLLNRNREGVQNLRIFTY